MSSNIGRLQRVALREVWEHEAQDFTQWLQNNIDVLNESLDLNLTGAKRTSGPAKSRLFLTNQGGDVFSFAGSRRACGHYPCNISQDFRVFPR
jgi:hypothetical protein